MKEKTNNPDKKTKEEERKELMAKAVSLAEEVDYYEYKLMQTLDKIKKLNPTKKEMEEFELQELFDMYTP